MSRFTHANALLVNGHGILVRGASKQGKSTLTLALIDAARVRGWPMQLIGDDRILLYPEAGGVMAEGHPAIAGKLELRGFGIVDLPFAKCGRVELVIDLVAGDASAPLKPGQTELFGQKILHVEMVARSNLRDNLPVLLKMIGKIGSEM